MQVWANNANLNTTYVSIFFCNLQMEVVNSYMMSFIAPISDIPTKYWRPFVYRKFLAYFRKTVFRNIVTLYDFGNEGDEKNNTNTRSCGCCFLDEFAVNGGRLPSCWAKRDATVSRRGKSERLFLAGFVSVTQSRHPRGLRLYIWYQNKTNWPCVLSL